MMRAWSVNVELATTAVDEDTIEQIHETLADYHVAVGVTANGNLSVQLTLDAATAKQAFDAAHKTVTRTARDNGLTSTVSGIEVLTEEEFDRRLDTSDIPALVGLSEVAEKLGVTRQRAGQLVALDTFPPAVAHLKSGPVFVADQVAAYGKRRQRAAGRPAKSAAKSEAKKSRSRRAVKQTA